MGSATGSRAARAERRSPCARQVRLRGDSGAREAAGSWSIAQSHLRRSRQQPVSAPPGQDAAAAGVAGLDWQRSWSCNCQGQHGLHGQTKDTSLAVYGRVMRLPFCMRM
eukprot:355803-Chlamydomonas_euryale.AAC.6